LLKTGFLWALDSSAQKSNSERENMPTISQLVRESREKQRRKNTAPALQSCPQNAKARRVHTRLHFDAKEAKFGFAKSCACSAHQRD
jgi:hypothetical protein